MSLHWGKFQIKLNRYSVFVKMYQPPVQVESNDPAAPHALFLPDNIWSSERSNAILSSQRETLLLQPGYKS